MSDHINNLKGFIVRSKWRGRLLLFKLYHKLLPSKHKWKPYETPECYPCCGYEGVNRICTECYTREPEGFNILERPCECVRLPTYLSLCEECRKRAVEELEQKRKSK